MISVIYRWAVGSKPHGGAEAQQVGEWLEQLRSETPLTPAAVKEAARPEDSPGHAAVFWKSPDEAAEAWYEEQAAYVLRTVVTVGEDGKDHRAFLNVTVQESRVYEPITVVMNSSELRSQILARALSEARDWQDRYRDFEELARIFEEIRRASD